jgi:hypothetical protein
VYSGEDAAKHFITHLLDQDEEWISELFVINKRMQVLTEDQIATFDNAKICYLCEEPFTYDNYKVRDHNHFTTEFLGAACNVCNMKRERQRKIPIYAHNGSRYDFHFLIRALENEPRIATIKILPHNSEHFRSITINNRYMFIDSLAFLQASLAQLSDDLSKTDNHDYKILRQSELVLSRKRRSQRIHEGSMPVITKVIRIPPSDTTPHVEAQTPLPERIETTIRHDCANAKRCCCNDKDNAIDLSNRSQVVSEDDSIDVVVDEKKLSMVLKKSFFPYEYCTSLELMKNTTSLPPIATFYSSLQEKSITPEDYTFAKSVWKTFDCKNLLDYTEVYCEIDTLLLAEIFHKFRKDMHDFSGLDPVYYISLPSFAFDSMMFMTKAMMDYVNDIDIVHFIDSAIRGGSSYINTRNLTVTDTSAEEIVYIDANVSNLVARQMIFTSL